MYVEILGHTNEADRFFHFSWPWREQPICAGCPWREKKRCVCMHARVCLCICEWLKKLAFLFLPAANYCFGQQPTTHKLVAAYQLWRNQYKYKDRHWAQYVPHISTSNTLGQHNVPTVQTVNFTKRIRKNVNGDWEGCRLDQRPSPDESWELIIVLGMARTLYAHNVSVRFPLGRVVLDLFWRI